jgi:hypothetical protein
LKKSEDRDKHMFLLKNVYMRKIWSESCELCAQCLFSNKRPRGCRSLNVNIRKVRWLKQLKVAISTQASVLNKQSPQNSWNKFYRLTPHFLWFQK